MTLVNTETGELVESLTKDGAERLSHRISLRLDTIADNYAAVLPLIREAIERQAHVALGYRSPGEYAADRFGDALSKLGPEMRQAVVRELSDMGMSTRAIAPVVGVSQRTVANDAKQVSNVAHLPQTPVPDDLREGESGAGQTPEGEERPDSGRTADSGQVQDAAPPRPPVTGIDGKTYSRPTPKPVLAGETAEYANAEQASKSLSRAIAKLLEFEHPNMRAGMRRYWDMASDEVPPAQRADVTPEQMRVAAHGLLALADEWTRR